MDGHEGPFLRRAKAPAWGTPITLFNGKSLDGWHTVGRSASAWSVVSESCRTPRAAPTW